MRAFRMKVRKKYSEEQFAGFFMDRQTETLITLLSLSEVESKSETLRKLIVEGLKNHNYTEASLCRAVAKTAVTAFLNWNDYYRKPITGIEFSEKMRLDLEEKGLPTHLINDIINKYNDTIEQNKRPNGG